MTERVVEGVVEQTLHVERQFDSMEQALDFARLIVPRALSINPMNFGGYEFYQLIYERGDDQ